jgi:hypothetical protein
LEATLINLLTFFLDENLVISTLFTLFSQEIFLFFEVSTIVRASVGIDRKELSTITSLGVDIALNRTFTSMG